MPVDVVKVEEAARMLLEAIGEDLDRDGIRETPTRYAKWWAEFIDRDTGNHEKAFTSTSIDQLVTVSGIEVWSLCEHHLLPFRCTISIGYIANDKVLGLSKFGRIAHRYAARLQVQERLTEQIANEIERVTECVDVAVVSAGEHLCMTMRGIRTPASMRTSVMRGQFRDKPEARAEFLSMVEQAG